MDPALCVHRIELRNVGDFFSTPAHYVPFLEHSALCDLEAPNLITRAIDKVVILGGGGLLQNLQWKPELLKLRSAPTRGLIAWGIGQNSHFSSNHKSRETLKPNDFDLFGIRDYGLGSPAENWVPCASCLHPFFDSIPAASNELVVFEHHEYPLDDFPHPGAPRLRNSEMNLNRVLDFLSSGEVVVTNSYHGAYWATLMGRKVVVVDPFSDKFDHFKHPPRIAESSDARRKLTSLDRYPEALEECRTANLEFADKVQELMHQLQKPRSCSQRSLRLDTLKQHYSDFRNQTGAMRRSIYPRRVLVETKGIIEGLKLADFLGSRRGLAANTLVVSDCLELFSGTGIQAVSNIPAWWHHVVRKANRLSFSTMDFLKSHDYNHNSIPLESPYLVHLLERWGNRLSLFVNKGTIVVSAEDFPPENVNKAISQIKREPGTLLVQIGSTHAPKLEVDIDLRGRLSPSAMIFALSRCHQFLGCGTHQELAASLGIPLLELKGE